MQDPSQGPSWLRNTDPLGIGLRERSRQARAQFNPTGLGMSGPLMDPMWDAYLHSMMENGVSDLADNSVGDARGMTVGVGNRQPYGTTASKYQGGIRGKRVGAQPSNIPSNLALAGLTAATKRKR